MIQYIIINFVLFVSHSPSEKATVSLTVPLLSYPFLMDKLGAFTRYGQFSCNIELHRHCSKKMTLCVPLYVRNFAFTLYVFVYHEQKNWREPIGWFRKYFVNLRRQSVLGKQTLPKTKSKKYTTQPIAHGSKRVHFFPSEIKMIQCIILN